MEIKIVQERAGAYTQIELSGKRALNIILCSLHSFDKVEALRKV